MRLKVITSDAKGKLGFIRRKHNFRWQHWRQMKKRLFKPRKIKFMRASAATYNLMQPFVRTSIQILSNAASLQRFNIGSSFDSLENWLEMWLMSAPCGDTHSLSLSLSHILSHTHFHIFSLLPSNSCVSFISKQNTLLSVSLCPVLYIRCSNTSLCLHWGSHHCLSQTLPRFFPSREFRIRLVGPVLYR